MLELAVARELYERYPDFSEGQLAKIRSHVVSRASCAVVARELGLGERMARAGRVRSARRADAPLPEPERAGRLARGRARRALPRARVRADRGRDRRGFRGTDRVRADDARRPQDRAAGGARASRAVGHVLRARGRRASARPHVHVRGRDRRRGGRGRQGRPRRRTPSRKRPARRSRSSSRPKASSDFRPACTCARSSCAASSRSRTRSRCASSRASPSSSARTAPASRTSPTRSSGPRASLAPSELRAEKPDDVLFAGGNGRPAGGLLRGRAALRQRGRRRASPFSELSVTRRLHRGGEGQYLVNRTAVRRIDLVELLADVGPRRRDALDHRPGPRRGDPRLEARGTAAPRRGGRRARALQAPPAPGRAEAGARRDPGRARPRRRGRGQEAAAAARAAGDRRRARGEARGEIASLRARIAELELAVLREPLAGW